MNDSSKRHSQFLSLIFILNNNNNNINNNNENNFIIRTSPQSLLLFITKCICNYLINIIVDLHSFVHVDGSCSHCHLDPYAMLRTYLESSF